MIRFQIVTNLHFKGSAAACADFDLLIFKSSLFQIALIFDSFVRILKLPSFFRL